MESLWGEEFDIEEKVKTKKILNKIKEPKTQNIDKPEKAVKSKKADLSEKLSIIRENVYKTLGNQVDNVQVIYDREEFHNYITEAIKIGTIAIDTETNNSTDPITCQIVGLCLYSEGLKQAYIPINHIDRTTKVRFDNQCTESDIKEELQRIVEAKTFVLMHNGKFDYQVIKCTCDIEVQVDWDTLIAAKCLDENEKNAGLKQQYIEKIDSNQEKYSFDQLFEKIPNNLVEPELFALYAATDSLMTYRLYQWQKEKFEQPGNEKLYNMFRSLETPLVKVLAEMELAGMEVDQEYAKLLSDKFHKRLEIIDNKLALELEVLKPKIDAWRLTDEANYRPAKKTGTGEGKSKSEQLEDPINLGSPTQLAILFYDILKCPQVSKKSPRGTGEGELELISEKLKLPICNLLIDRRELVKLISTYIDVIPETVKIWPDHRLRTHFNQYGAATGRLSSGGKIMYTDSEDIQHTIGGVNFQNIPANEKTIRMLFKAKDGYRIVGGDFSAQEPRLTAFYSQDENMIKAYREGQDLYSVIASMSFDRKYEDCLEFYPEGTHIIHEGKDVICGYKTHQNKEGKKYRSMAKSILLGVLYGRGAASVGEQIGKSKEEAQIIIDKFFKAFPKVKRWIDKSISDAHKYGYVEDIAGRRRRLPDILLPKYDIKDKNEKIDSNFNPFLPCADRIKESNLVDKYIKKLANIKNRKEYEVIQAEALKEGVEIHDNTGFIAQAERQAVNSRVQGGAASLTKNALLSILNDDRLKKIEAKLINTVHDEILLEVPEEYSIEAEKLLVDNMVNSAKIFVPNVPMQCDTYNVNCWYCEEYFVLVESEFKHLLEDNLSILDAFEEECNQRCESTRSQIYEIVKSYMNGVIPPNVDVSYKSLTRLDN